MIWLYRIVFLPLLILASPYYLRRMLRRGGYATNFAQRFGFVPPLPEKLPDVSRVWIQAVSVGEILAIGPLLEDLKRKGGTEVYLSTTTSTGYRMALDRYTHLTIGIAYFPVDFWPFSARTWSRVEPDLAILTEGERWPEHIHQAKRRGIPLLCINARMSDRGYRRMRLVPTFTRWLFNGISLFLPCSKQDAERLKDLGFPSERICVTGNIKLDIAISELDAAARAQLLKELGLPEGKFLLVGSSTWPGEEEAMISALRAVRRAGVDASLLLVPRHAERRIELATRLREHELKHHFRSSGSAPAPVDIAVGDTTGELRKFLQLADLVFVGKSLPPHHEGQTPVEAAALGKPILFGPEMSNFRQIAQELTRWGATRVVHNASELVNASVDLAVNEGPRLQMARAAQEWHRSNQGALARTMEILRGKLEKAVTLP